MLCNYYEVGTVLSVLHIIPFCYQQPYDKDVLILPVCPRKLRLRPFPKNVQLVRSGVWILIRSHLIIVCRVSPVVSKFAAL